MNIKKGSAKLGKIIQDRFNSYSELKGSGAEMRELELAVAQMVIAANQATEKEIPLN